LTEPKKPADSLVQELLAERRELKVQLERARMEVEEARAGSSGPDPRVKAMETEIERLRHQLATTRAEAGQWREELDALRQGVEKALEQLSEG
jgi:chromosome segregation ATPase